MGWFSLPILSMAFGIFGCAQPVSGLWPPGVGDRTFRILVSVDSWHSVIGLWPESDRRGERMLDFEEWGYAEKGYYLEGDTGCSGTCRALFVPSTAVVQVTRAGRPWSERTPQPPGRSWSFELSERGYRCLREHLEKERIPEPIVARTGPSEWYLAAADYHLFHHCHHWTARALRAAGLPVWSFYAPFRWSLEAQLDRAEKFGKVVPKISKKEE